MGVRVGGFWFVALVAAALAAGCNSGSVSLAPVRSTSAAPTSVGSSSPATATPTPKPSSAPVTPTPTPHGSTAPTPTPLPSSTGSTACTAPAVTAGNFTSIETEGVVSGNAYTDDGNGDWEAIAYSPATPTPTPTVTATPVPTSPPTATPVPAPTPTPVMITLYYGEYTVSSYSGNALLGASYTTAATTGCFFLILEQPVGGSAGQIHQRHPAASVAPSPNAFGDGEPNEPGTEAETVLDEGSLTSLTINGLTPTSGSGSLSFTNTASASATGTITITGSETITASPDAELRRIEALRSARKALIIRSR